MGQSETATSVIGHAEAVDVTSHVEAVGVTPRGSQKRRSLPSSSPIPHSLSHEADDLAAATVAARQKSALESSIPPHLQASSSPKVVYSFHPCRFDFFLGLMSILDIVGIEFLGLIYYELLRIRPY
jgi:hypothetical protein